MTHDPHPWAQTLDGLFDQAWARLIRGVHDRHAPARHPTLATITPDQVPQARTVVLRAATKAEGVVQIHTDLHSAKVADLRATPKAALHVWDSGTRLQIRLNADVTLLSGPQVAAIWAKVPEPSRASYGSTPATGQPIASALDYRHDADPAAFAVLLLTVQAMDLLHLGPDHRRARFLRSTGWAGEWLAP